MIFRRTNKRLRKIFLMQLCLIQELDRKGLVDGDKVINYYESKCKDWLKEESCCHVFLGDKENKANHVT